MLWLYVFAIYLIRLMRDLEKAGYATYAECFAIYFIRTLYL